MKFNILLATYNGEAYLEALLDSLLSQRCEDFVVTVRDDGSSDRTCAILHRYAREDARIRVLPGKGRNLGYPDCFWYLLKKAEEADYYAFCDQDDIWKPDKLAAAMTCLDKRDTGKPMLYAHGYDICDRKLQRIGEGVIHGIDQLPTRQLIFYSPIPGFSMVINHAMRETVLMQKPWGKNIPHDLWMLWNARFLGEFVYDEHSLAIYRRHEDTATPTGEGSKAMLKAWLFRELLGDDYVKLCGMAAYFIHVNKGKLPEQDYREWKLLCFRPKSILGYWKRIFYPKRLRPGLLGETALRLLFLSGR